MRNLIKLFAFTLFLGAVLFPVAAFASSSSGAGITGEGAVPISGWAVSNVDYQLSDTARVSSVSFDLDAPAQKVLVKLKSDSTDFTTCTNVGGFHWQCNFAAGVSPSSMDEFRVIAVGG